MTSRASAYAARVRGVALSLPQAYEDDPWGFPVFKVANNRLFAWMIETGDALDVTVKMTDEERPLAFTLPFVRLASHVGRYGWITASVSNDEMLELALDWLQESWWLRAPVRVRRLVAPSTADVRLAPLPGSRCRGQTPSRRCNGP